jgi:hypothetical protein
MDKDQEEKEELLRKANDLSAQVTKLQSTNAAQGKETKNTNRGLDVLRRLVQLGTSVVMALLILLWLINHPGFETLTHGEKTPILAGMFIVCGAYIVALEIGKGSSSVVIFLVASGLAVSSYAAGYATSELRRYLA